LHNSVNSWSGIVIFMNTEAFQFGDIKMSSWINKC